MIAYTHTHTHTHAHNHDNTTHSTTQHVSDTALPLYGYRANSWDMFFEAFDNGPRGLHRHFQTVLRPCSNSPASELRQFFRVDGAPAHARTQTQTHKHTHHTHTHTHTCAYTDTHTPKKTLKNDPIKLRCCPPPKKKQQAAKKWQT